MYETVEHVLVSSNAAIVLIFLAFIAVIAVILAKKGILNIHTSAVQLGAADQERDIIRQQLEWTRVDLEGVESSMPKPEGYNQWLGKYVVEAVYDEYVDWITFNHINASPAYVEIKQDKLVSLIRKLVSRDEFRTPEFEDMIREDTRQCIEKLIQIRKVYKK